MVNKYNLNTNQILIASDHAGYLLKEIIKKYLVGKKFKVLDLGTHSKNISVDYPVYAKKLSKKINTKNCGILVCGSGIGMSMASNRFKNVRSALVSSSKESKLSRQHNNANVICLGARLIKKSTALKTVISFLTTYFEGGRLLKRVTLLN